MDINDTHKGERHLILTDGEYHLPLDYVVIKTINYISLNNAYEIDAKSLISPMRNSSWYIQSNYMPNIGSKIVDLSQVFVTNVKLLQKLCGLLK